MEIISKVVTNKMWGVISSSRKVLEEDRVRSDWNPLWDISKLVGNIKYVENFNN